jgi:hypothetical protein
LYTERERDTIISPRGHPDRKKEDNISKAKWRSAAGQTYHTTELTNLCLLPSPKTGASF